MSELSKGDDDSGSPEVTITQSKDGMKPIPGLTLLSVLPDLSGWLAQTPGLLNRQCDHGSAVGYVMGRQHGKLVKSLNCMHLLSNRLADTDYLIRTVKCF